MGSSAGGITTTASKAVILGSEANAEKDGGVALGADSVASVDKDIAGYDPSTKLASTIHRPHGKRRMQRYLLVMAVLLQGRLPVWQPARMTPMQSMWRS